MLKEKTVVIPEGERAITVVIKQMPALKLERFLNRAAILLAAATGKKLASGGLADVLKIVREVGKSDDEEGDATIFQSIVNILGNVDYDKVEPLYKELMECCYICPDQTNPGYRMPCTEQTIEGQIENPITLYKMRYEALKVNLSFFTSESPSNEDSKATVSYPKLTKTSRRSSAR